MVKKEPKLQWPGHLSMCMGKICIQALSGAVFANPWSFHLHNMCKEAKLCAGGRCSLSPFGSCQDVPRGFSAD